VVGASTGGPKALELVFRDFPALSGVTCLIVQHMPIGFTRRFANRLNDVTQWRIEEAIHGSQLQSSTALVIPAGKHGLFRADGPDWYVDLTDGDLVHFQRPAVDLLMQSIPADILPHTVGCLLTGMGKDGARGMLSIREGGGWTIAESAETCTVYGMPRAAVELKAVCELLAVQEIPPALTRRLAPRDKF
jgi:two-component system chemotaxis response regulator CheB